MKEKMGITVLVQEKIAIPWRIMLGVNENPPPFINVPAILQAPMTQEIMRSRFAQCKTTESA